MRDLQVKKKERSSSKKKKKKLLYTTEFCDVIFNIHSISRCRNETKENLICGKQIDFQDENGRTFF